MSATPANVHLGTGRRKTSTARVRITEGSGKLTVNGRTFEDYFSHDNFAKQAYAPLLTVEMREKIDVTANVAGGGVAGQAGAVSGAADRAAPRDALAAAEGVRARTSAAGAGRVRSRGSRTSAAGSSPRRRRWARGAS